MMGRLCRLPGLVPPTGTTSPEMQNKKWDFKHIIKCRNHYDSVSTKIWILFISDFIILPEIKWATSHVLNISKNKNRIFITFIHLPGKNICQLLKTLDNNKKHTYS
jgi:hypothetical protein